MCVKVVKSEMSAYAPSTLAGRVTRSKAVMRRAVLRLPWRFVGTIRGVAHHPSRRRNSTASQLLHRRPSPGVHGSSRTVAATSSAPSRNAPPRHHTRLWIRCAGVTEARD